MAEKLLGVFLLLMAYGLSLVHNKYNKDRAMQKENSTYVALSHNVSNLVYHFVLSSVSPLMF